MHLTVPSDARLALVVRLSRQFTTPAPRSPQTPRLRLACQVPSVIKPVVPQEAGGIKGSKMARNSFVAFAQSKLDETRREVRSAVVDFDVPDEKIIELRQSARRAYEELKELDRKASKQSKQGLFGFLGF